MQCWFRDIMTVSGSVKTICIWGFVWKKSVSKKHYYGYNEITHIICIYLKVLKSLRNTTHARNYDILQPRRLSSIQIGASSFAIWVYQLKTVLLYRFPSLNERFRREWTRVGNRRRASKFLWVLIWIGPVLVAVLCATCWKIKGKFFNSRF